MTASEHGSSPSASRCSEDAIFDALAYLVDIVGDLHETGKTSETRLELLHKSVWELHAIVKAQRSARKLDIEIEKAVWRAAHDLAAEELPRIRSGICQQPGLAASFAVFAIDQIKFARLKHAAAAEESSNSEGVTS